ncbi:MAG: ABC transporter ATP-binding protein, partial [Candidatus Thorarchaeota archaeon]
LQKEAQQGKICVNLEKFHSAIIELPIQLREVKIWANRFMDIAFLSPESGGVALESTKDNFVHKHEEGIVVEALGIHKTYSPSQSTVYALRGANLKVRQGEFVAVLGPSGAGKTTLINIMAGLDVPDRGQVFINGKNIANMSDNELSEFRRNNIGFIFQQYLLDPRLNVQENVTLPALMAGKTKSLDTRVHELLESLGLAEYAQQDPMKLSGGQMQRVIIARACINSPLVVFADEPTGDLDSETGRQVLSTFRQLCDKKGITFIMVTHDQEMAAFADRIVHMKDGQILSN